VLSSFGLPLPSTCLLLTVSEARSYFASTVVSLSPSVTKWLLRARGRGNIRRVQETTCWGVP
jgi:hypothetical protein